MHARMFRLDRNVARQLLQLGLGIGVVPLAELALPVRFRTHVALVAVRLADQRPVQPLGPLLVVIDGLIQLQQDRLQFFRAECEHEDLMTGYRCFASQYRTGSRGPFLDPGQCPADTSHTALIPAGGPVMRVAGA